MTKYYNVIVNGMRYAVVYDKEQAENIARASRGRVEEIVFYAPNERGKENVRL